MWDDVNRHYSDLENSTQMCDMRDKVRNLKHGDLNITRYFNAFITLWHELDMFNNYNWSCPTNADLYNTIIKK